MNLNRIYTKEITKDNKKIVKVTNKDKVIYLGSKYNEINNVNKFIKNINIYDGESTVIIIGLSFGSYLDELIESTTINNNIIIVEPDKHIYDINSNDINIISKLKLRNIKYIYFKDDIELTKLLKIYIDNSYECMFDFCIYTNYDKVYKDECKRIMDVVNKYINYIKILRNSNVFLKEDVVKNYINNFKNIEKCVNAKLFINEFKGKSGVVVSSGPSLEKNIKYLKEYKDNLIIISVLRSVKELIKNGIRPHFICVLDPKKEMFEIGKDILELDIPIVCVEQANAKLLSESKGSKIFGLNSFGEFIHKITSEEFVSLSEGGSVSHIAISFAILLGLENIIFIGQDLAFTGMKKYSCLSRDEELLNKISSIEEDNIQFVKGIKDDVVPTDESFILFREWIENTIINNKDIRFINSTEGGARIYGAEEIELKDALLQFRVDDININCVINNIIKRKADLHIQQIFVSKLIEIKDFFEEAVNLSNKLLGYYNGKNENINFIINRLDQIDIITNEEVEIINLINFVSYKWLEEIQLNKEYRIPVKENEIEKNLRICKRQIKIYESYLNGIKNILKLID